MSFQVSKCKINNVWWTFTTGIPSLIVPYVLLMGTRFRRPKSMICLPLSHISIHLMHFMSLGLELYACYILWEQWKFALFVLEAKPNKSIILYDFWSVSWFKLAWVPKLFCAGALLALVIKHTPLTTLKCANPFE